MCGVLILDDDRYSAKTVKIILENSGEVIADVVTTTEEFFTQTTQRAQEDQPYEVIFLLTRGLEQEKTELFIWVMKIPKTAYKLMRLAHFDIFQSPLKKESYCFYSGR